MKETKKARIVVCRKCGMHAHLEVGGDMLGEAISKEQLLHQTFQLLRDRVISLLQANELSLEIVALPRMYLKAGGMTSEDYRISVFGPGKHGPNETEIARLFDRLLLGR